RRYKTDRHRGHVVPAERYAEKGVEPGWHCHTPIPTGRIIGAAQSLPTCPYGGAMSEGGVRRRTLLGSAAIGAALVPLGAASAARAGDAGRRPIFTLGVASGDPFPDRVMIWTRLAPEPTAPDGGMPNHLAVVEWELARDERFHRVV